MVFSSLPFLFFYLMAVLAVYKLSPLKIRNLILLLVSLFFYGWGEPVYIFIMLLSIAVDYTHGRLVERWRENDRLARRAVASSDMQFGHPVFLQILGLFRCQYPCADGDTAPGTRPAAAHRHQLLHVPDHELHH